MKIYKKDCIGRVPSSIRELEECALCENEQICMSLWGAVQIQGSSSTESKKKEELSPRRR